MIENQIQNTNHSVHYVSSFLPSLSKTQLEVLLFFEIGDTVSNFFPNNAYEQNIQRHINCQGDFIAIIGSRNTVQR